MPMIRNTILNELKIKLMELDHGQLLSDKSYRDSLLGMAAYMLQEIERIDRDTFKSDKV